MRTDNPTPQPGASAPPAKQPTPPLAGVNRDRVKAQMRRWQDCVLDLTKSNPLIGLNRSRVAKLLVIAPDGNSLFSSFVLNESHLKMPLVRKAAGRSKARAPGAPDENPGVIDETGVITVDAAAPDLIRWLRRVQGNAPAALEEGGVAALYLTFGAL